jgi:RND family efflux transporter MFP subunit
MKKAILFAALLAAACGRHEPARPQADEAPPLRVQTAEVVRKDWPSVYEATGTVRARVTSVLSARIMSYVQEVRVQAGDQVRQGQVLVVLDARDLDAGKRQAEAALHEARSGVPEADNAVAAAKAQLELAQVTFRRMEDLFQKRSISNQEFDEASARVRVARASHDMALARRAQLDAKIQQAEAAVRAASVSRDFAELRAPFAGVVTERRAEPGSVAAPGAPLLVIEQAGGYQLEAAIEESRIAAIRVGTPVTVILDALDKPIETKVSEIVPALDPAARTFTAKIRLAPMPHLRSGLFGRARFTLGSQSALAIPAAAVRRQGQMESVWVVEGGRARHRLITAGAQHGEWVEVLSGLREGERIIAPLPVEIADGRTVEAQ